MINPITVEGIKAFIANCSVGSKSHKTNMPKSIAEIIPIEAKKAITPLIDSTM